MPQNGKTINSQYIEKQRKKFFKNFKKTLYKNVHLCDEKNKHKAMGSESALNAPLFLSAVYKRRTQAKKRQAENVLYEPTKKATLKSLFFHIISSNYFSSLALDEAAAFEVAVKSSAIRADLPRNARKK